MEQLRDEINKARSINDNFKDILEKAKQAIEEKRKEEKKNMNNICKLCKDNCCNGIVC